MAKHMYRPSEPFTTTLELLNPVYTVIKGVTKKDYEVVDTIQCLFKTYGGTESDKNDVLVVVDTANVETWYRPDITSGSRLRLGAKIYEVIGEPEDISQRHQFLKFKVRGIRGGV